MLPILGQLWRALRRVEEVFERQDAQRTALIEVSDRLGALDRRVARLEEREAVVVAEARGAAAATGTAAAAGAVGDLSRRLGVLEERSRGEAGGRPRRLRPPAQADKDDE